MATLGMRDGGIPQSLRLVVAGMERVNAAAYAAWKNIVGTRVRWLNAYGPTETTVTSLSYEAGTSKWEDGLFVPIGRPIANMRAYVLDSEGRLLPNGIPGELHIAGPGVARGYLNAPNLTADRFLPDPFSDDPASRLYRTGDRVFRLPDGNFVFLGRTDRQVKVRGYRVELDEIESVLMQCPAVRRCAVILNEDQNLAAYVTIQDDKAATPVSEIRRYLSRQLPGHMIPRDFLVLPSMPLTASGKIDYPALPAGRQPMDQNSCSQSRFTGTERRLAAIWRDAVGSLPDDPSDDFFLSGGNSLSAAALTRLIQAEFGRELSLTTLLQAPTLAALARLLDSNGARSPREGIVPLRGEGGRIPIFAISPVPGDASCFRELALRLPPDQPFFAVDNPMGDRFEPVAGLASRVREMIQAVRPRGPYVIAGYCFGGLLAFETAHQMISAGESVHLIVLFDTPAPGYPKVLNTNGYWRQLRTAGISPVEMLVHARFLGRLLAGRARTMAQKALIRTGLAPNAGEASLSELIADVARTYVPKPIRVPVVQFIGKDQRVTARVLEDPRLGWKNVCKANSIFAMFLESMATDSSLERRMSRRKLSELLRSASAVAAGA